MEDVALKWRVFERYANEFLKNHRIKRHFVVVVKLLFSFNSKK